MAGSFRQPLCEVGRGVENMIGIFYIAVIVAGLVSSYRAKSHRERRVRSPAES